MTTKSRTQFPHTCNNLTLLSACLLRHYRKLCIVFYDWPKPIQVTPIYTRTVGIPHPFSHRNKARTIIGVVQEMMTWILSCSRMQIAQCDTCIKAKVIKTIQIICRVISTFNFIISLPRAIESMCDLLIWVSRNTIVYVLLMCHVSLNCMKILNLSKSTAVRCYLWNLGSISEPVFCRTSHFLWLFFYYTLNSLLLSLYMHLNSLTILLRIYLCQFNKSKF